MPLSATDKVVLERVNHTLERFIPETKDKVSADRLREHAEGLALVIIELCNDSYERAMALSRVEEAVMWTITASHRES
jgi:hypothetical protein